MKASTAEKSAREKSARLAVDDVKDPMAFTAWLSQQPLSTDDIPFTFGERLDWEVIVEKWDEAVSLARSLHTPQA